MKCSQAAAPTWRSKSAVHSSSSTGAHGSEPLTTEPAQHNRRLSVPSTRVFDGSHVMQNKWLNLTEQLQMNNSLRSIRRLGVAARAAQQLPGAGLTKSNSYVSYFHPAAGNLDGNVTLPSVDHASLPARKQLWSFLKPAAADRDTSAVAAASNAMAFDRVAPSHSRLWMNGGYSRHYASAADSLPDSYIPKVVARTKLLNQTPCPAHMGTDDKENTLLASLLGENSIEADEADQAHPIAPMPPAMAAAAFGASSAASSSSGTVCLRYRRDVNTGMMTAEVMSAKSCGDEALVEYERGTQRATAVPVTVEAARSALRQQLSAAAGGAAGLLVPTPPAQPAPGGHFQRPCRRVCDVDAAHPDDAQAPDAADSPDPADSALTRTRKTVRFADAAPQVFCYKPWLPVKPLYFNRLHFDLYASTLPTTNYPFVQPAPHPAYGNISLTF